MHPTSRRLLNGLVVSGTAVVAMIVGHCGGHQIDAWVGSSAAHPPAVAAPVGAQVAHHAHHLGHGMDEAAAGLTAAGPHAGHAMVLPMASGAFLVAVTAGLVLLLTVRHRHRLRVAPVRTLLGAQLLAFVVLEAAQRQLSVDLWAQVATDRRIWLGLALQPVVAWIVHRVGRRAAEAVAELLAIPVRPQVPGLVPLGFVAVAQVLGPSEVSRAGPVARGPPCERFLMP